MLSGTLDGWTVIYIALTLWLGGSFLAWLLARAAAFADRHGNPHPAEPERAAAAPPGPPHERRSGTSRMRR